MFKLNKAVRIYGSGANDNVLVGNFIGTDAAGSYSAASGTAGGLGVMVLQGAKDNRIGGSSAADRNVVSGNPGHGIATYDESTDSTVIVNNIIGLDPSGTKRLSNRVHGVDINLMSSYSTVGGTQPGERNVISGNSGEGVEISHNVATVQNKVVGNFIGTDATGNAAPDFASNYASGVQLEDGVTNNVVTGNVIGNSGLRGVYVQGFYTSGNNLYDNWIGVSPEGTTIPNKEAGILVDYHASKSRIGPGNTIANNAAGVRISSEDVDSHTITRNSIFGNADLGIDLDPLGSANSNDAGDADSGPNEQLNFPVLTDATMAEVSGTACGGCTVEVFVADGGADAHGEGKTFAGAATAAGDGTFVVATSGVAGEDYVTATATDAAGNTSEFSPNKAVAVTTPDTAITSGPSGSTRSTSASFDFSSEPPGAQFQCSLDGAVFAPCASPKSYMGLTSRLHTFRVRAIDSAGNVDSTPAARSWTVDTVRPTVSGMSPRNTSIIRDTTPTIKAIVRDNLTNLQKANVRLYVNGILISPTRWSYSASTDVLVYNSLRIARGKKTVRIVAIDAAGNVRSASWYFTIR